MSRRTQHKNIHARAFPVTNNLARQVRGIVSSLTIPTILTACAPMPSLDKASGHSSGAPEKTVLYVKSRTKSGGLNDPEKDYVAEKTPEPTSPAGKFLPNPGDVAIFENILSKYSISPEQQAHIQKIRDSLASTKTQPSVTKPARASAKLASVRPALSPKPTRDGIWERMRKRLMLTAYDHESVMAAVAKIQNSPGALNYLSKRAEPFLFYIVDEIERRGLPMDLAMVPMVESAFEPAALSPKQAAGVWQFIPGTATDYGLKLVDGYDGRYDLYASTKAALKYLSHLQGLFGGDWLLALAAYNAGEGAVQKAIQANQKAGLGSSFWELNLPAETKAYVPKILALSRIIADPASYGVKLHRISSLPYLARVEVNAPAPLAQALESTGISWAEFFGLNPAFKPDIPPSAPFNLLLPHEKAEMLAANLPGSRVIAARKYVVKKGDTLTVIAKHEGVPTIKLAEWNGLKTDSRVKPGQELIIYPV